MSAVLLVVVADSEHVFAEEVSRMDEMSIFAIPWVGPGPALGADDP